MNTKMLNEMLDQMDEEERELLLAADDAYDRLYAYRLEKEYGVEVVCNPDGDRTKIMIDGVVMNQEEFAEWLCYKNAQKYAQDYEENQRNKVSAKDNLPTELEIDMNELEGILEDDDDVRAAVKNYLRETYGYYLAKGNKLDITVKDKVVVKNIAWGRKR